MVSWLPLIEAYMYISSLKHVITIMSREELHHSLLQTNRPVEAEQAFKFAVKVS
jgi:hypothetical protein